MSRAGIRLCAESIDATSSVTHPPHPKGQTPLQLAGALVTSECNYPTPPEMGTCCRSTRQHSETVDEGSWILCDRRIPTMSRDGESSVRQYQRACQRGRYSAARCST